MGGDCKATAIWSIIAKRHRNSRWELPVGQTKNNQQLTTASTFHYVGAAVSHSHPTILSGGIFNITANKCKLTPVFDTSSIHRLQTQFGQRKLHCKRWQVWSQERFYKIHRTEERGIQRGYFVLKAWLLCTQHSKILFHELTSARQSKYISFALA